MGVPTSDGMAACQHVVSSQGHHQVALTFVRREGESGYIAKAVIVDGIVVATNGIEGDGNDIDTCESIAMNLSEALGTRTCDRTIVVPASVSVTADCIEDLYRKAMSSK